MRIGLARHMVHGACGAAILSFSVLASAEERTPPAPPADGVSTNQIMFKKPVRRTYGKKLDVVRSDVKINPHPKAVAGDPSDKQASPVATLDTGRSVPGAANYYNQVRAAQARQQQAANDKQQDSLWLLPRSSLLDLNKTAESEGPDKMSSDNAKKWGWMAEGMQRINDDEQDQKMAAEKKDSDQDVIDAVVESLALDRARREESGEANAEQKKSVTGQGSESRSRDKSRTTAKDSDASRPWDDSADRPSGPEEEEDEAPAPWLAQPSDAKPKEGKDAKEDKPHGWASNDSQGWNSSRDTERPSSGSLISGGAWANSGWGSTASPNADSRLTGNMNNPWSPSSAPTNSMAGSASGAALPALPWTTSSPSIGGPTPIQSSFQPVFVQPGAIKTTPVSRPSTERPYRPNYLDPTASRR